MLCGSPHRTPRIITDTDGGFTSFFSIRFLLVLWTLFFLSAGARPPRTEEPQQGNKLQKVGFVGNLALLRLEIGFGTGHGGLAKDKTFVSPSPSRMVMTRGTETQLELDWSYYVL